MPVTVRVIPIPSDFDLEVVISSYGFSSLAPNEQSVTVNTLQYENEECKLLQNFKFQRPLRYGLREEKLCNITLTQTMELELELSMCTPHSLTTVDENQLVAQVERMCRLGPHQPKGGLERWYDLCPRAREKNFGRLFRSPSVWEDLTILVCNVNWKRSKQMSALLCNNVSSLPPSFPTPQDIIDTGSAEDLKRQANLGYRHQRLWRLAQSVLQGSVNLEWLDQPRESEVDIPTHRNELEKYILNIYGFGPYATHNMLQLLGYYDSFPYDSETLRHFRQKHSIVGTPNQVKKEAQAHYLPFSPYQFIAYWFELWEGYQEGRKKQRV